VGSLPDRTLFVRGGMNTSAGWILALGATWFSVQALADADTAVTRSPAYMAFNEGIYSPKAIDFSSLVDFESVVKRDNNTTDIKDAMIEAFQRSENTRD